MTFVQLLIVGVVIGHEEPFKTCHGKIFLCYIWQYYTDVADSTCIL